MNKLEFQQSASIKSFIHWLETKMDTPDSFVHSFEMKKPRLSWKCNSIFSAYENYGWPFYYKHPITGERISGKSFNDCAQVLSDLSSGLKKSIQYQDHEACKNHCLSILDWGGVLNNNDKRVENLGTGICDYFNNVLETFNKDLSSDQYYTKELIMNSGFTKIYSLLLEDFVIYDGRLGAALGLIVRKFCEENELDKIPDELLFAWGRGKESKYKSSSINKRNPSSEKYKFPELLNNPRRHTESSVRANWLIEAIIAQTESRYKSLNKNIKMRALESALFMIGYEVKKEGSLSET